MNGENGTGSIQLKNGQPSSAYAIGFCPFPTDSGPRGNQDCFSVTSNFMSDASGNASVTFQFSKSGTWAGIFLLGGPALGSGFEMPSSGVEYHSPLKRSADITPWDSSSPGYGRLGADRLTSGFVEVNGGTVNVSLNGALADAQYSITYCGNEATGSFGGSACHPLGNVNTDSSGSASEIIDYRHAAGTYNSPGIFYFSRNDGGTVKSEFITAFSVP
jgi:hypothetical protein